MNIQKKEYSLDYLKQHKHFLELSITSNVNEALRNLFQQELRHVEELIKQKEIKDAKQ